MEPVLLTPQPGSSILFLYLKKNYVLYQPFFPFFLVNFWNRFLRFCHYNTIVDDVKRQPRSMPLRRAASTRSLPADRHRQHGPLYQVLLAFSCPSSSRMAFNAMAYSLSKVVQPTGFCLIRSSIQLSQAVHHLISFSLPSITFKGI